MGPRGQPHQLGLKGLFSTIISCRQVLLNYQIVEKGGRDTMGRVRNDSVKENVKGKQ